MAFHRIYGYMRALKEAKEKAILREKQIKFLENYMKAKEKREEKGDFSIWSVLR